MRELASEKTIIHSAGFAAPFVRSVSIRLSNLRGAQVVNGLGWLVQIRSLCAHSRSPKTSTGGVVGERERSTYKPFRQYVV